MDAGANATTAVAGSNAAGSAARGSSARIDNHQSGAVALDLSYQELKTVADVQEAVRGKMAALAAASRGGRAPPIMGVRLCYNSLTSIKGLAAALSAEIPGALECVTWLDLSTNNLTRIEDDVLQFAQLTSLYLHSNNIRHLADVKKLAALSHLTKLTMHNNTWVESDAPPTGPGADEGAGALGAAGHDGAFGVPGAAATSAGAGATFIVKRDGTVVHIQKRTKRLESSRFYREQILWALRDTKLRNVDFMAISQQDRQATVTWSNVHLRPRAPPKKAEGSELQ
jgi:hypothetical protein